MLVLKYQDSSSLLFLFLTYPTAFHFWANCSTIQRIVILQKWLLELLISN